MTLTFSVAVVCYTFIYTLIFWSKSPGCNDGCNKLQENKISLHVIAATISEIIAATCLGKQNQFVRDHCNNAATTAATIAATIAATCLGNKNQVTVIILHGRHHVCMHVCEIQVFT
jgi:hypothetical protein